MSAPCSWALPLLLRPRESGSLRQRAWPWVPACAGTNGREDGVGEVIKANGLLRRDALWGEEGFELDRLAADGGNQVAGRHRLPVRALGVERLGDDEDVVARFPVVERVGGVVGGITERVEVAAVGERGSEAQRFLVAVAAHHVGQDREDAP